MINLILVVALLVVNCMLVRAGFCSMTAVTYNTALRDRSIDAENTIPNNRLERRDQIIQMLNNTDADVICLQEVWLGEDVKAIVDGVNSNFPYSFSKLHKENSKVGQGFNGQAIGPLCNFLKLFAMTDCMSSSCTSGTTVDDYWTCMTTNCSIEYAAFIADSSEDCITCVITALPNISGILESCSGAGLDDDFRKINSPGLLLLSKDRLRLPYYYSYYHDQDGLKEVVVRGTIETKVRGIMLICAHLSTDMSVYPEEFLPAVYGFSSYAQKNLFEATDISDYFRNYPHVLVMGDFNSGLEDNDRDINGTMEASYNLLSSTFLTRQVSECTVCDRDKNPYNVNNENYISDGFFGNGVQFRKVKRVYTTDDGSITYNGQTLPLSDHYGVQAIITDDL